MLLLHVWFASASGNVDNKTSNWGGEKMLLRRRAIATFVAAMALMVGMSAALNAAPAENELRVPKLEFREVKLENGLRVILVPDHSAPVYAIDVCYNVGSRNERPGRTG